MAVLTTCDQPRSTEIVGGVRAVRRRRRFGAGDLLPRRGRRAPPPHLREEVSRRFATPGAPSHSLGAAPRRRLRSNNVERRRLTGLVGRRAGLHRNVQLPRRGWQSGRVWGQPGLPRFAEERSICVRPVRVLLDRALRLLFSNLVFEQHLVCIHRTLDHRNPTAEIRTMHRRRVGRRAPTPTITTDRRLARPCGEQNFGSLRACRMLCDVWTLARNARKLAFHPCARGRTALVGSL